MRCAARGHRPDPSAARSRERGYAPAIDLKQEATDLLARLIQFDTVNPPGNERAALEFLRDHLEAAGLECELLGMDPERPNLVARLEGDAPGERLGYLGHVDTVLADPEDWQHDPWSGHVDEQGVLWGRGALDMKSQVAAEVAAAAHLARNGWRPPRGDLLVFAVADEEAGGALGAQYLCREHPDKVRCDYLLNEGGGTVTPFGGRRIYSVGCGEKGTYRFAVATRGVAGHASMPAIGDNALLKLAPLLTRLSEAGQPGYDLTEIPRQTLKALVGADGPADPVAAVERVREIDPRMIPILEPTLGVTLVPTRISASAKINVIPAHAELQVDCRVPPGLDGEQAVLRVREIVGEEADLRFMEQVVGNYSSAGTSLMGVIQEWLGERDPGSETMPSVLPGFTDSRWWRDAFPECVAYGFFPMRHMDLYESAPLVHSADERIDLRDLAFAAEFFAELPRRLLK